MVSESKWLQFTNFDLNVVRMHPLSGGTPGCSKWCDDDDDVDLE